MKNIYTIIAATLVTSVSALEKITSLEQLNSKINQHTAVIIKVYRDDCPPCRQLAPIIAKLATAHPDYACFEVNSSVREITASYGITRVPTILYFYNGKLVGHDTGFQSYTALEKRTKELFK